MVKKITYPKYTSKRTLPKNFKESDKQIFYSEFNKKFPGSYMIIKKNVRILNLNLSKYNNLFSYTEHTKMSKYSIKANLKNFKNSNFSADIPKKNIAIIEKGSWIVDEKSFHYFHWMCDALPRLLQIIRYVDEFPVLLPSSFTRYSYIIETLETLNINYIIYEDSQKYLVKNLLISSHVASSGNFNKENIIELSRKLQCNQNEIGKKIWVSRKLSKHRKISNENELYQILKKYNYDIVYPEKLSFKEQVNLFSNTKVISGLHGGGLTNMLFMKKNSIVFELRRENDNVNNCYFSLASELDLKYYYSLETKLDDDLYVGDVHVNVDNFRSILDMIEDEIL